MAESSEADKYPQTIDKSLIDIIASILHGVLLEGVGVALPQSRTRPKLLESVPVTKNRDSFSVPYITETSTYITIPYRKFGRRTIFSKRELLAWIEERATRPSDSRSQAALRIAASARNVFDKPRAEPKSSGYAEARKRPLKTNRNF